MMYCSRMHLAASSRGICGRWAMLARNDANTRLMAGSEKREDYKNRWYY